MKSCINCDAEITRKTQTDLCLVCYRSGWNKSERKFRKTIITKNLGDKCFFNESGLCSGILQVHKKDGNKHKKLSDMKRVQFLKINWSEYVYLCNYHHASVHRIMELLHLKWGEIKNLYLNR